MKLDLLLMRTKIENVPRLMLIILVCNLVNNSYQQYSKLFTFVN